MFTQYFTQPFVISSIVPKTGQAAFSSDFFAIFCLHCINFRKTMTLESYLLFVLASVVLCVAPGPDMIFILTRTLAQGRKAGVMAAVGINMGAYVHLIAAVLGLSAILATSAVAFSVIKWLGAAYLVFIGIQVLRNKQNVALTHESGLKKQSNFRILWQGFLSDVLNPKVAIFFLAFLPQFVNPQSGHPTLQIVVLGITTNVVAIAINLTLVYFSGALTAKLHSNQKISEWLNKTMGVIFITLGFKLASEKI